MARNRYAGNCFRCGCRVEVGEGFFQRNKGRWLIRCRSCVGKGNNPDSLCPTREGRMASDPLTLEKLLADLRRIKEELGSPPPEVRVSPYATGLPTAQPRTDDMREMVDRLGKQRVPAAYRLSGDAIGRSRDVIVVHPDLLPGAPDEH